MKIGRTERSVVPRLPQAQARPQARVRENEDSFEPRPRTQPRPPPEPAPTVQLKDGPTNRPDVVVKDGKVVLPGGKVVDPPAVGKYGFHWLDDKHQLSLTTLADGRVWVTGELIVKDPSSIPTDAKYVEIDATWDSQKAMQNVPVDPSVQLPPLGTALETRKGKLVLPGGKLVDPPPPNADRNYWIDSQRGVTVGRGADGKFRVTGHSGMTALKGTVPIVDGKVQPPGSKKAYEAPPPGESKTYKLYEKDGIKGTLTITTNKDGTASYEYGKELPTFWNRVKGFFDGVGKWIKKGIDWAGTILSFIPGAQIVGLPMKLASAVWGTIEGAVKGDWLGAVTSAAGGFAAGAAKWGSELLGTVSKHVSNGLNSASSLFKAIKDGNPAGIIGAVAGAFEKFTGGLADKSANLAAKSFKYAADLAKLQSKGASPLEVVKTAAEFPVGQAIEAFKGSKKKSG
ncbi:MAG: hypothetical protein HYZ28_17935 [Myxococcales bacterium]|nr:hypothetical protein [Myxococcales bacterium]